ncbi:MAG: hypothetical protein GY821_17680 [Gammaproteobacteria bacterium]|nr:hypothetical protein [Gammaproteobacteria bacterium]
MGLSHFRLDNAENLQNTGDDEFLTIGFTHLSPFYNLELMKDTRELAQESNILFKSCDALVAKPKFNMNDDIDYIDENQQQIGVMRQQKEQQLRTVRIQENKAEMKELYKYYSLGKNLQGQVNFLTNAALVFGNDNNEVKRVLGGRARRYNPIIDWLFKTAERCGESELNILLEAFSLVPRVGQQPANLTEDAAADLFVKRLAEVCQRKNQQVNEDDGLAELEEMMKTDEDKHNAPNKINIMDDEIQIIRKGSNDQFDIDMDGYDDENVRLTPKGFENKNHYNDPNVIQVHYGDHDNEPKITPNGPPPLIVYPPNHNVNRNITPEYDDKEYNKTPQKDDNLKFVYKKEQVGNKKDNVGLDNFRSDGLYFFLGHKPNRKEWRAMNQQAVKLGYGNKGKEELTVFYPRQQDGKIVYQNYFGQIPRLVRGIV